MLYCLQVRALSGSAAFKSDEPRFVEVADASLALAQTYLDLHHSSRPIPSAALQPSIDGTSSSGTPSSAGAAASASPAAAGVAQTAGQQLSSTRELAAARMHLRGLLKQCEPVFGEHVKWQALSDACAQISAAESSLKSC